MSKDGQGVAAGLFTTDIDFGVDAFSGDARWLEIDARCPAGSGPYETLSPRQELTPTPNALHASKAATAADAEQLGGSPAADYVKKIEVGGTAIYAADLPLTITESGSYYLAENINYAGAGDGITVTVSNVTINLNELALIGTGGAQNGITGQAALDNIAIRNGTVRGWGGHGIQLSSVANAYVEGVYVTENTNFGMLVGNGAGTDNGAVVRHCRAIKNGSGIRAMYAKIDNNVCSWNTGWGIKADPHCVITNNVCNYNTASGIDAQVGTVVGNTCNENADDGILANTCTVAHNTCDANQGAGHLRNQVYDCTQLLRWL